MTEKEERNFEQKMFDIISTQGAAAAAINCMEIAKDYALCKQVKKLNIDDVSCCKCIRCGTKHPVCLKDKMCYTCDLVTEGNYS